MRDKLSDTVEHSRAGTDESFLQRFSRLKTEAREAQHNPAAPEPKEPPTVETEPPGDDDMLTGCLALARSYEPLRMLHFFLAELLLLYFPFSALMHTFTFPFSRAAMHPILAAPISRTASASWSVSASSRAGPPRSGSCWGDAGDVPTWWN